ncbi:metal-dependent hydrolase [Persicobacter diffluens]|uniref:UPF0173 metal-dependent hydrolase PEDI_09510 n=1 Tax=Persicobacter diffluens TaxID=981 RepID=A0AAN5AJ05_9BACT|nr:UPF0173 metal-dependent hydrolase [Persicobacter diffluens]
MKITYFGHAAFMVEVGGQKILFDPFITPNELAKDIDINSLQPDVILVSHAHQDHIVDVEAIAKNANANVVATFEVANYFAGLGVEKVTPMNHGGTVKFDFGKVKMVNAIHTSSFPDGSYGGNPAGFVISTAEGSFYYAGDTALTYDMKLIAEEFDLKFAILPIGDHFTMGIDDALKAADFVGTTQIVPMHFDTFPPIAVEKESCLEKAKAAGKALHFIEIGKSVNL